MSDIYLAVSETPTVVTLTSAVINSAVASSVTVVNTVTVSLASVPTHAITGTVTVGNSVTIGSLPAISGTVTANVQTQQSDDTDQDIKFFPIGYAFRQQGGLLDYYEAASSSTPLPVYLPSSLPAGTNRIGVVTIGGGTVTIGAGTAQIGSVTVGNSVTIGSLPSISGVVTANVPGLADVFESYDEGLNQAVVAVHVKNFSGEVFGSTPFPISGSVTANIAISSTAITSGSFASLTSATLVPRNTLRKMATVYNLGAGQLFVNAGASATTLGGGFMVALSSGDFYECDYTTTTLSAIFATAGTASWVSH